MVTRKEKDKIKPFAGLRREKSGAIDTASFVEDGLWDLSTLSTSRLL